MRILLAVKDSALAKRLGQTLGAMDEAMLEQFPDEGTLLAALAEWEPALVLLDLESALNGAAPGTDPSALLERVRQLAPRCPLLVLTGEGSPRLRADCLLAGAADCLSKPLSLVELRARCLALLRRARAAAPAGAHVPVRYGALTLDRLRREASVDGAVLRLTGREFALLVLLASAPGQVLSRAALAGTGSGASQAEANPVDVHLAALRRKLREHEGAPSIETHRGLGFRLTPRQPQPVLFAARCDFHSVPASFCRA